MLSHSTACDVGEGALAAGWDGRLGVEIRWGGQAGELVEGHSRLVLSRGSLRGLCEADRLVVELRWGLERIGHCTRQPII